MGFVHLHCHTQYSLLDGAIKIGDLLSATKAFGQDAVAITDHGVMYGVMELHDKARAQDIKPVLGCELYVAPGNMEDKKQIPGLPKYFHLVLLAQNEVGYQNLLKIVSLANIKGFYHKPRADKKILAELNEGLVAMSACLQGEIPYWLLRGNEDSAVEALEFYRSTFDGRFYLEIQDNGLDDQNKVNPEIVALGRRFDVPIVATNDCHYLHREDAKAHEALLCIQTQKTLMDKSRMSFETDQLYLKSPEEMAKSFSWIPEAVEISGEIADSCNVEVPMGLYFFPEYPVAKGKSLADVITERAWEGLRARIGDDIPEVYSKRLEKELDIIRTMGFPGYFLIVADYIQYAKDHGVPVGPGRGSAAGSLVAFSIRITDIDPIRWNLLFERFLNPERKSMPDIDVDFCQARRDEVIEYVKNKYGADRVSQITTFGNMKAKAVIRDVGRVLGMSFADVNRIAKLIPDDLKMTLDLALEMEPKLKQLMNQDPMVAKLMDIARALEGLSRHVSVHAGGVVISDNRPISEHVPVYVDKKGMLISQYDKRYVERVGLIKFDMLGLKTLTVIREALDILRLKGVDLDIGHIPIDDPATFKLIGDGDTASVFQLESSGMQQMLRQLKPEKFEDIIAAVALYRPGPMDLIPSYIERRHGREVIVYPHPMLEPILEETYGIIVYQEQVMQIAQVMGGYSLGKADILRRAMGKKSAEIMVKHRAIFLEGALKKGVDEKKALEIFALMEKFAQYGFNKSHAAAYAFVSYQTAYLKIHHFPEFMAANLTLDLNNTDKVVRHIAECKAKKLPILSPDINESGWEFIPTDKGIRFGLGGIKNVGKGAVDMILEDRETNGWFEDLESFITRMNQTKVNRRVIEALIKAGAFDSLHPNRRALFDSLDVMIEQAQRIAKQKMSAQGSLFSLEEFTPDEPDNIEIPDIPDWPDNERLKMEKEGMGFYISGHPMQKYTEVVEKFSSATTLSLSEGQGVVVMAGILSSLVLTRTKKGDPMARAVLEDLEGSVPVIFFPRCFAEYQDVIVGEEPVIIKADVKLQDGEKADEESEFARVDLFAKEVYPIEQAQTRLARKVVLRIGSDFSAEDINTLKDMISRFNGSCVLSFEINTPDAIVNIDAGHDFQVNPTRDFMEKIRSFLGPSRVEMI